MTTTNPSELTSDERARLEEEREHLLDSLDDLDAELTAGDIDQTDYDALRDDYTARTAQLSRALDSPKVVREPVASTPLFKRVVTVAVVVLIAGAAGFAMTQFSGGRGSADVASGEIRNSSAGLKARAQTSFRDGNFDEAIELYGEALEISPNDPEALTFRGWAKFQQGDATAAKLDFDEAVAVDDTYGEVWVFRSIAALAEEDFEQAQADLDRFDALDPSPVAQSIIQERQVRERIALGVVSFPLEQAGANGIPDFESAGVAHVDAQRAGEVFVGQQLPVPAIQVFDGILSEDPENAQAAAWRGWTLALTAQTGAEELFPEAQDWLDRAVEFDPDLPDARVFRAFVFNRLGEFEQAQAELVVFDDLENQPTDMVALLEQFSLREAIADNLAAELAGN